METWQGRQPSTLAALLESLTVNSPARWALRHYDAIAQREVERKAINARWVTPLTALNDRVYTSLQGLFFDRVVRHDPDTLNCGASIDAWVNLVPAGTRVTLRLIYGFQAYDHPRCQLGFSASIEFQENRGATNSDILQQETMHLIEGTADEQRVVAELNGMVDRGLQDWSARSWSASMPMNAIGRPTLDWAADGQARFSAVCARELATRG